MGVRNVSSVSIVGGHPEFSVVRARAIAGVGLRFDHDRHVVETAKARAARARAVTSRRPIDAPFNR